MAMSPEEGVRRLTSILTKIHGLLEMKEYDEGLRDELSKKIPNYMDILENRKKDIIKKDSSIVITGETSAGKTTLINSLVGEKIFVASNVAATGKICRIRNSETLACKYYTKQDEMKKEENAEDLKELKKMIKRGTDVESMTEEDRKEIYFVDVLLPFQILEGSVIIVDTPGIGESKELDKILLGFLPDAVSFIFVVNARNAGGVQEGRLKDILKSILDNRDKMPCFNCKEVLFVTNQWDIVEEDIDDDDEDETEGGKEKTWRIINEKLTMCWPEIDEKNIFRVSLKQVINKTENEYTSEYTRFREILDKNIRRNVHHRFRNHFSFLEDFMKHAELGCLGRLEFLSKSEEDKQKEIENATAKTDALETDCKKKSKEFLEDCDRKIEELAFELWSYLNFHGKEKILNPPELPPIEQISYLKLGTEIPRRIEAGVRRWCIGSECKEITADAESRMESFVKEMSFRIQEIRAGIIGVQLSDNFYEVAGVSAAFGLMSFLFPITFVVSALMSIVFVPTLFVFSYFWGTEWHTKKVNEIYDKCIAEISREDLEEKFAASFGKEYKKSINKIFGEEMPKEIRALRLTLENLESERQVLKDKEASLRTLKMEIERIRQEMTEMGESLSGIIYQEV
ncbi:uncharacterized protein LOC134260545 [Saccostrea cucullata]|uniref:uncharacterized protein LOC134260545 n=1 Tax=Saccostrea cuccullata TaxID=36930 RepID=UPI002ED564F1